MGYSCAIYGCLSSKRDKDRSFHRFPKDKKRCKQWIKACSRMDLKNKSEEDLYKSHIICDLHFEKTSCVGTRLKCNAIPTLMLPGSQEEEDLLLTKSTQTIHVVRTCNKEIQTDDVNNLEASSVHTHKISKYTQTTAELISKSHKRKNAYSTKIKKRRVLKGELDQVETYSN